MAQKAVTISTKCLIPLDDYEDRLADIVSALERGLQMAGASYTMPRVRDGISREASDAPTWKSGD